MNDAANATTTSVRSIEHHALRVSMVVSLILSSVALVWGVAASSQVILFDGIYGAMGIFMTWLSLVASRAVAGGATERYPYGREALAPLVIAVQGVALLGACGYAAVDAVLVIVDGGSDVSAESAIVYAVASSAFAAATWLWLRRSARHSDLLAAEATQWAVSTGLSAAMIVGFAAAAVMSGSDYNTAGRYVDPLLVIASCVLLSPAPIRMIRTTVVELLEGAPPPAIIGPVDTAVEQVRSEFGLHDPNVRMSKLGRKVYVEVGYVVHDTDWAVTDTDRVRRTLNDQLTTALPYDLWLTVEISGDPHWFD